MNYNVGPTDRLIRIIIGLVIAIVGVIFDSWWGLIGIVPLATGLFKFCPVYAPFKISTVREEED